MPSRKHIKPPPTFSFVTLEFEAKETRWLKIHSGAVRSHSAYWGGPARRHRQTKKHATGQQGDTNTTTHGDGKPAFGRGSTKRKDAKAIIVPPIRAARSDSPRYIEPDNLHYLPSGASDTRAVGPSFAAGLSTFKFCRERFVKQFVLLDHADYSIMFSGCLLLSYAHSMALTGQGTKTVLLELKGQVIRHISARMKASNGLLSPRCLIAILALGAPIVCLVSQDLPKCLSICEYINASMDEDYLCCQESADTAQSALNERIVHRQAIRRLFFRSNASFQDADNLALLQYVSNCVNISMAIEAGNPLNTPGNVGDLFPVTGPCENCSLPAEWTSPLTCQWFDEISTIYVETQMLLLAGLMHKWLSTFLDGNGQIKVPTQVLLEERASLRDRIEGFVPVARTSNMEADAMYESCRWASLVLLAVEKLSVPIHVVAKQVRTRPRLIRRLRITDLSNLWGTRKGLLFWVNAICHFAIAGQCFPLLCETLFARFVQEVAMSDFCSEIAIKPLRRLKQFESLCCRSEPMS